MANYPLYAPVIQQQSMMPIAPMAPSQYVSPFDALMKKQSEIAGSQMLGQQSGASAALNGNIAGGGGGVDPGQLFASRISGGFK